MDERHRHEYPRDSGPPEARETLEDARDRARAALEARDWLGAEAMLREALVEDPAWVEGHADLGVCLARRGNLADAKGHLLDAIRAAPDNIDAHYDLGVVYQELGEYESALSCYKEVVLSRGDDSAAYTRMAECAESLGRTDDAIILYGQVAQLQPHALAPALALAKLYLANEDLKRAYRVIRAALAYHPGEPLLSHSLGLVLEMQGRYRDALPLFRAVVQADDHHEEAFFHLGYCAQAAGFGQEAETFFARAIDLNPEYLEAVFQLGELYRESGQLRKAVVTFEECLRRIDEEEARHQEWGQEVDQTRRVPVLNALGLSHRSAGHDNWARSAWEESLGLDPDQEEVRAWLGEVKPLYRRASLTID